MSFSGRSGRSVSIGTGSSLRILLIIATEFSARNGSFPVRSSYITTPSE
jgi:hypothetical protein